jgi:G3E family GTPase
MRTTVVSGMLGSGKTTFIGHLLRDARERTVVLVNDFGALGIDGQIFSAAGIEAVELPSGCVCCTLKLDLITTVGRIRANFDPEHLVIEPSGVASPSGVLEALASAGVARVGVVGVVGVVDATEFLELHEAEMFGTFFRDQIVNADVILVNKTDLAGAQTTRRTVAAVEGMNPAAIVLRTVQARLETALPEARRERPFAKVAHAHFGFETVSSPIPAGTQVAVLERLLADLAAGRHGRAIRAKALAATDRGPWRLDLAFGNRDSVPFAGAIGEGRLVVIGTLLDGEGISRRIRAGRTS